MSLLNTLNDTYKIESSRSKEEILGSLSDLIKKNSTNSFFTSLFKYPDYKSISIVNDHIIAKNISIGWLNWSSTGAINITFVESANGTTLFAKIHQDDFKINGPIIFCLVFFIGAVAFVEWQSIFPNSIITTFLTIYVIGICIILPFNKILTSNKLKDYLRVMLYDLDINNEITLLKKSK